MLFALVFIGYGGGITFGSILGPLLYRRVIDTVASAQYPEMVWDLLLRLLLLITINSLIQRISFRVGDVAVTKFQSKTMKLLMDYAYEKVTNHSYTFFTNAFAGGLVTKVKRFVRSFEDASDQMFFIFWMAAVQVLGVIVTLFFTAPYLAILFCVWTMLYLIFAIFLTKKKVMYDMQESSADSKVTARLADTITNILNIKMFSSRSTELAGFGDITLHEQKTRYQSWSFGNRINTIQSVMFGVLEIASIAFSLFFWKQGLISAGTIVLIQIYLIAVFQRLWEVGKAMGRTSRSLADAAEMVEIFETPLGITDPSTPETLRIKNGAINLEAISFQYQSDSEDVFEDFTLHIGAGQHVGLVGHSGAGKSTITKLLLRFADVQKGAIMIDGQDIRHITQDNLRSKIAYVPQDPILFHRSLRENIAYGNPNATEEEIIAASKKAHAHEFISTLPQGYDTLVGERGIKLSGGERQRVAIARAMLKDAPILILDEATSSLDSVSEGYIQEALWELMRNRTTIVIAHRLSTIQHLDRIVVLEDGKIVEDGNHKDLLEKKGQYANFWEHQTAGFIE